MIWHAGWHGVGLVDSVGGTRACNGHFNGIDREEEGLNVGAGEARTSLAKPWSFQWQGTQGAQGTRWVRCMQEGQVGRWELSQNGKPLVFGSGKAPPNVETSAG